METGLARRPVVDPVENLTALQRRVANMLAADMSVMDISRFLEADESYVSKVANHPAVQRLVFKLTAISSDNLRPAIEKLNEKIATNADEAFDAELEIMRNMRDRQEDVKAAGLCFSVAKDILDRAGAAQPKRIETKNLNANLSGDDFKGIREALVEMDAL